MFQIRQPYTGVIGLILVVLSWGLATKFNLSPQLLPSPTSVAHEAAHLVRNGTILDDISSTLIRWLIGFSSGALIGVILGLALGIWPLLRQLAAPSIDFFRSLPATALFPLFLLLFGIGDSSKIAMAGFVTALPVLVATVLGLTEMSAVRKHTLSCFGAGPRFLASRVYPFQAAPFISAALHTTISFSLMVTVVGEMFIGSGNGIGQRLYEAFQIGRADILYAYVISSGLLGMLANLIFGRLDNFVRSQWS